MEVYENVVKSLPPHLKQYVVEQNYARYTPIDQATWRFILRQLKSFLSENAHECYLEGLKKTGITIERIPKVEDICEKLQKFGWSAVPVSGFIPPAAFMEMQSLGILPIASDMRAVDHILYTPAPDIVHEAAGHAPILVNPQFAEYLKEYAQVAKKALISSEDLAQYEAIRDLSDIKEDPDSTKEDIQKAEERLERINNSISHISEAAMLGRMNWWTAEYGLIGPLDNPKIFGAGLLSSVGEARSCLKPSVKKIPLTVDCVNTSYDITEQQPQLFVAEDFSKLPEVLEDLAERLSFRKGGLFGLEQAQKSKTVNTIELDSGLQISGKLTDIILDEQQQPCFIKLTGPTQLNFRDQQLAGHDKDYHGHGFSSPLGNLKGTDKELFRMNENELKQHDIEKGKKVELIFESGIIVNGEVISTTFSSDDRLLLICFKDCTTKNGNDILFQPEWGTFDMAVGTRVESVFAGPADREAYGMIDSFTSKVIPLRKYSEEEKAKHQLYQSIRDLREKDSNTQELKEEFEYIMKNITENFSAQWLAILELVELTYKYRELENYRSQLVDQMKSIENKSEYIDLGLRIADQEL